MHKIFIIAKLSTKRLLRDKTALFFTFLFPLIFLLVFGFIFKGSGGTFNVALFNQSSTEFSKQYEQQLKNNDNFKFKEVANEDEAKLQISRDELDGYIVLPPDFGEIKDGQPSGQVILKYGQANEQAGQTLTAVLTAGAQALNQQLKPYQPPISVKAEAQALAEMTRFDFTLSGLIGFALLSLGIFGMANGFVGDKKTGALARLQVTPLRARQLVIGLGINRILIGLVSVAIMLVMSMLVFGFRMHGSWLSLIVIIVLGAICMFGLGLIIGGYARTEEQAAPLANLMTLPMMFLSGVFFPRFLMPGWLQSVSGYLPLTPIVDGIRLVITEGRVLTDLGPQIAIIAGWTVVSYVIASLVFRWE